MKYNIARLVFSLLFIGYGVFSPCLSAGSPLGAETSSRSGGRELIFIDEGIPDRYSLLQAVTDAGMEPVLLNRRSRALDQIEAALSGRSEIGALHIVSHGRPGSLEFGSGSLGVDSLSEYAAQLRRIGQSLGENGDILLYGCDVGGGGTGKEFLNTLASVTGADIAASTNATGVADRGGDWTLEAATGDIAHSRVTDALAGSGYGALLGTVSSGTKNFESATQTGGSGLEVTTADGNFVVTTAEPSGMYHLSNSGQDEVYINNHSTSTGTSYSFTVSTSGTASPAVFILDSVNLSEYPAGSVQGYSGSIVITGYDAGSTQVATYSVAASGFPSDFRSTGGGHTLDLSATTFAGKSIKSFTIQYTPDGEYIDSIGIDLFTITINAAPTISGSPSSVTVTEDTASNVDLSGVTVADGDGDNLTVTLTANSGTISHPGGNGTFSAVTVAGSGTSAMTLAGTAGNINTFLNTTTNVKYTSASNDTTSRNIALKANDGTVDSSTSNITVNITAVNDAPVLDDTQSPTLTSISEEAGDDDGSGADGDDDATNNANNGGTAVADIVVDGSITDADGSAVEAIAVTAVDNTNGVWQYSTDNGSTWNDFTGVSGVLTSIETSARLLDGSLSGAATQRIRFVPNADFAGTVGVVFRAWDKSTGAAGGTANATSNGGATAFSSAYDNMVVTVSGINDTPVFTGLDGTPAFTEDGSAQTLDGDVTVSDVELVAAGDYAGASLTIVRNGGAYAVDVFSFASGGSFAVSGGNLQTGGLTFATFTSSGGTLTVNFTSSGTTASQGLVNDVLQHIQYQNTSNDPAASVQLDWTFSDGNSGAQGTGGAKSATGSTTVSVTNVNDPPSLTATAQNPTYVEGAAGSDLYSSVTASTEESTNTMDRFTAMTLTVTNVFDGASEILTFDGSDVALTDGNNVASTATNGLDVSVSETGSTATVAFSGASLTQAQLQTLVDALAYRNTSNHPTTGSNRVVTITYLADNGGVANGGSNTATPNLSTVVSITPVNDPPVVANVDGETAVIIAGAGTQTITVFDDATVDNVDSADYNGGHLSLTPVGTFDGYWALNGTTTTVTSGGDAMIAAGETIAVSGSAVGTVDATKTGQSGAALQINFNSIYADSARLQTLIRNITYSAPSGLGDRVVTLVLNDGDGTANSGDEDAAETFTINVTPSPPVVSNLDGDSVSTPNNVPVAVDQGGNVTVTDADSGNFNGGNLTITRNTGTGNFSLTGSGSTGVASGTSSLDADGTIAASEIVFADGTAIATVSASSDGQGTNNLVFTLGSSATPATVQQLIRALQFASTTGGSNTFTLVIEDAATSPGTSTAAGFTVNVEAAPVNTVPGVQTGVDGAAKAISGVSVTDADSASLTTTLTAASGTISVTAGGASITGNGSGNVQVAGTVAQVNATLAGLSYTPAVDSAGAQSLTVVTSDGTNSDTDAITINVSDRPDIANLAGAVTFVPGSAGVVLDAGADAQVTDTDNAHFNGGTLTLSVTAGAVPAEDVPGLDDGGSVAVAALTAGSNVSVGGMVVGTLGNAIAAGNDLVIGFNTNATLARVSTLLQALRYANAQGATPTAGTRTLTVTLDDGTGNSANAAVTVAVPGVPLNTLPGGQTGVDGTAKAISGVSVSDADSTSLTATLTAASGTITVTAGGATITGNGSGNVQVSGTIAQVNTALGGLSYTPLVDSTGAQTLTLVTSDGTYSDTDSLTITVSDRPDVDNLAGNVAFTAGSSGVLLDVGLDALVTDADNANFNGGTLTLSVTAGAVPTEDRLTLGGSPTVTVAGLNAGDNVVVSSTVVGVLGNAVAAGNDLVVGFNANATLARVSTLVQALQYENVQSATPTAGTRTLTLTLEDGTGNTTDATVTVYVPGVPANTLPGAQTGVDGSAKSISGVSVSDADSASLTVTLTAGSGTITVTTGGGAVITGNGSGNVTVSGTIAQVNAALGGLSYTPQTDSSGAQTLILVTSDGTYSDSDSLTINVSDRPDISNFSGSVTFAAGADTVLLDTGADAQVTDADSANFNAGTLTLSVTAGAVPAEDTLVLAGSPTVTVSGLNAGDTVSVGGTIIGMFGNAIAAGNDLVITLNANATPARVATLIQALGYENAQAATPTAGARTLTLTLADGTGNNAVATVTVNVQAVQPITGGNAIIYDHRENNGTLRNVTIGNTGSVNGGTLAGTITNRGAVSNVVLGAAATINGGTLSGRIVGSATFPGEVNSDIAPGAYLENVIVGIESTVDPGVSLGPNVLFESIDTMPPGLDLTGLLSPLPLSEGGASILDLGKPVLKDFGLQQPTTLLGSLAQSPVFTGSTLTQQPGGPLVVDTDGVKTSLVPVAAGRANGETPGTTVTGDGEVVIVTADGYRIVNHPALVDEESMRRSLGAVPLAFDARANLVVGGDKPLNYVGRPAVLALPTQRFTTPGLKLAPRAGETGLPQLVLVVEDEDGNLLEQAIEPVPADWPALKGTLAAVAGVSDVAIGADGVITFSVNGRRLRAIADYAVRKGAANAGSSVRFVAAGDLNGDGTGDFSMVFANGDSQWVYILP